MNLTVRLPNAARTRRTVATAITCGAFLLLPSCKIPSLRPAETGLGLPANFNGASGANSSENLAHLRVDEFYNDAVLSRLVCEGLANNRELKILEEDVQIARSEIISRRGAFLPFASLRAGAGWERNSGFTPLGAAERELEYFPGKHFPETPGDFLFGLNFLLPIDIWRELRNARDSAIQRYFAAIERRNNFVTRMVADIAENYYGLMALDKRIQVLDQTIELQQQSYEIAKARRDAGRDTELSVQRFLAEVRKNQSEKLIVRQEIIEVENKINFLAGRLPQPVERNSAAFLDLNIPALNVGVPAQLLLNRPDVRQAEREMAATGLDVKVARAHFFPRVDLVGGVGYRAFNPKYLFMTPEALVLNAAGELTAPLINRTAIRAEYLTANARQLQSVYDYQRVVLDAFTEVINRMSQVENYSKSIAIKRQQLQALEAAVEVATKLYLLPRGKEAPVDYLDVLFAQRDMLEARTVLIDTKRRQLAAIVNTYQALGGGTSVLCPPADSPQPGAGAPQRLQELPQLPAPREAKGPPDMPKLPKAKDAP